MGKISLINIAEELAAKSGLSKDVTDNFLHAFIETIEKGLNEDNLVKVKGLGTFKLMEMSDRGSIDVNTGGRITIKGYTKVSFTPDNAMKEFVNRPFSHFEPTELNDGYREDELIDTFSSTEAEEDDANVDNVAEQVIDECAVPAEAPTIEIVTADTDTPSDVIPEETSEVTAEDMQAEAQEAPATEGVDTPSIDQPIESTDEVATSSENSDVAEVTEIIEDVDDAAPVGVIEPSEVQLDEAPAEIVEPVVEPANEAEPVVEAIVEADSVEVVETESVPTEIVAEAEQDNAEEALDTDDVQPVVEAAVVEPQSNEAAPSKRRARWPFVVVLLALAGGVYYYASSNKSTTDMSVAMDEEASIMVKPNLQNEFVDEPSEAPIAQQAQATAPADTIEAVELVASIPVSEPEVKQEVKSEVKPEVKSASKAIVTPATLVITESLAAKSIKDITPADTTDYIIDGTQCSHTLQSGETIIQLARKYYGDKRLWPYIVKHNHITDFNKVGVGMEIRIPVLNNKAGE